MSAEELTRVCDSPARAPVICLRYSGKERVSGGQIQVRTIKLKSFTSGKTKPTSVVNNTATNAD